jgi:hypothetical protein
MLIGTVGTIGSGKGTITKYLIDKGFRETAFADSPKYCLASIFNWDFELLKGTTQESREWREKPDPYWSKVYGREVIPRKEMQKFATDVCRDHYESDLWVQTWKKKYLDLTDFIGKQDMVVSDVRHHNEMKAIKELGGTLIYVEREDSQLPEWLVELKELTKDSNNYGETWMKMSLARIFDKLPHNSEWDWIYGKELIDFHLKNDSTIENLGIKVEEILTEIPTNDKTIATISKSF